MFPIWTAVLVSLPLGCSGSAEEVFEPGGRLRDFGLSIGRYPTGPLNAITDVPGVLVGHHTLVEGDNVRTGVTVVLPHRGNLFREKVPAAIAVQNGFGKLIGFTQVRELGNLESPIALTNTLNVPRVADGLISFMLAVEGNEKVRSINVVVGETNDGRLNDIRSRAVTADHVRMAIESAQPGPVAEGSVGAGTGTICFGFKGGIGTSSRRVGNYLVGALVQSNFGGNLTIAGVPVTSKLSKRAAPEDGSCMIVIATNAAVDARNLRRLARRSFAGMARTGASFSNGSGDYCIAFSTAKSLREVDGMPGRGELLTNDNTTALFVAVAEATEEAILNSLFKATDISSKFGSVKALPLNKVLPLLDHITAK